MHLVCTQIIQKKRKKKKIEHNVKNNGSGSAKHENWNRRRRYRKNGFGSAKQENGTLRPRYRRNVQVSQNMKMSPDTKFYASTPFIHVLTIMFWKLLFLLLYLPEQLDFNCC
jgi:hypothetical protein